MHRPRFVYFVMDCIVFESAIKRKSILVTVISIFLIAIEIRKRRYIVFDRCIIHNFKRMTDNPWSEGSLLYRLLSCEQFVHSFPYLDWKQIKIFFHLPFAGMDEWWQMVNGKRNVRFEMIPTAVTIISFSVRI